MSNVVPITPRRTPELGDGKQAPHDPYAEAAVLTACLLKPDNAPSALAIASPADFHWRGHQVIAECIADLVDRGEPWDETMLAMRLSETGKMAIIGGPAYLTDMAGQVPAIVNPQKYAERVRDLARLRRLAMSMQGLLGEVYEPVPDVAAFLARVDSTIGEVTRAAGKARAVTALSAMKALTKRLGETLDDRISTGFRALDGMTTGLEPEAFYVLGGRPGMGKTAFAIQLAVSAAKGGRRVLFVSLEMSHSELMARAVSGESGVPLQAIRKRQVSPNQWSELTVGASRLAPLPLVIADGPSQTLLDIRAAARQERAALVIVDHIGIVKPPSSSAGSKRSREQEVAEISRGLKALAKELRIPVVAIAQVNREVAKAGARPGLSNLRESGSLEQDADGVWFVHRPAYYDPRSPPEKQREAELIVAKQRNGPTGIVPLTWLDDRARFEARAE